MTEDVDTPPTTSGASGTAPAADPRPAEVKGVLLIWARRVVVAAVIGVATHQVVREWDEVSATLRHLAWPHLVLALGTVAAGVLLGPLVWRAALAAMGTGVGVRDAARIYLVGQLGKYVPGSVVAFVLQMELARAAGISRARGLVASLLTAGIAVVTSLIAGLLAVPALAGSQPALLWLFGLLPVGLALLHPAALTPVVDKLLRSLRQGPLPQRLTGGAIARASGLNLLVYLLYGVHLFALVDTLQDPWPMNRALALVLCVGAMGVAMTAGVVAFVLPSGIGAREVVIVGALAAVLPYGQALALAVVSRVLFTVVELACAGAATLAARVSARRGARA